MLGAQGLVSFAVVSLILRHVQLDRHSHITRIEYPLSSAEEHEDLLLAQLRAFRKSRRGRDCERLVIFVDDLDCRPNPHRPGKGAHIVWRHRPTHFPGRSAGGVGDDRSVCTAWRVLAFASTKSDSAPVLVDAYWPYCLGAQPTHLQPRRRVYHLYGFGNHFGHIATDIRPRASYVFTDWFEKAE